MLILIALLAIPGLCLVGGIALYLLAWAREERDLRFERYAAERAAEQ